MKNKPVMLQNVGVKLLVAGLCVMSFIAGMYAHKNHQANACQALGGQIKEQGQAVVCLK